ncbi:hypothetical protein OAA15_00615 [bacterium]|nr:hypothetical protein [bacterium]
MTALDFIKDIDKDGEDWSNDTLKIADVMEAYAKQYHEQQVKNCLIGDVVKSECKTCNGEPVRREFDGSIVICLDC